MGQVFNMPPGIKDLGSQRGKPIVASLLSVFRQIESNRTLWKGHPDFGPENEEGKDIIILIRDNISANFL